MIKTIVIDRKVLSRPCEKVEKVNDVKDIITDLKDTLESLKGRAVGLSANQIGYNKAVSYIKLPSGIDEKTKTVQFEEIVVINGMITQKEIPVKFREMCISFGNIVVETKRYVLVGVSYLDKDGKEQKRLLQGYSGIIFQHEIDHQQGLTMFNRKWVAR